MRCYIHFWRLTPSTLSTHAHGCLVWIGKSRNGVMTKGARDRIVFRITVHQNRAACPTRFLRHNSGLSVVWVPPSEAAQYPEPHDHPPLSFLLGNQIPGSLPIPIEAIMNSPIIPKTPATTFPFVPVLHWFISPCY